MERKTLLTCADLLLQWYQTHFRMFPWRQDPTPYHVWISEIMLQQTRIEAAMPYYERFVTEVPDIRSLAALPEERLLKLWEGLGYYSRARNLQKAARIVCEQFGGELPADHQQLLSLPGIGEYAAGAIASIAFSIPASAVDGNVMRVLARLCGDDTDVLSSGAKAHFSVIADAMVPQDNPGAFNQALMELGETVCLPNTLPHCEVCPLQAHCVAHAQGTTMDLPVRIKRTKRRIEHRDIALIIDTRGDTARVLLHKRGDNGLLAGMWEYPNNIRGDDLLPADMMGALKPLGIDIPPAKHVFSHIEWRMTANAYTATFDSLPADYVLATAKELQGVYALPSAFRAFGAALDKILCKGDISK